MYSGCHGMSGSGNRGPGDLSGAAHPQRAVTGDTPPLSGRLRLSARIGEPDGGAWGPKRDGADMALRKICMVSTVCAMVTPRFPSLYPESGMKRLLFVSVQLLSAAVPRLLID